MRLGRAAMEILLRTNVVELRFRRRLDKPGFKNYRRMLCTKDYTLLQSTPGKTILNYVNPTGHLKYNPAAKNLIVSWDIFMCNHRMINCDDVEVIAVISTSPDPAPFWKYFNERLVPMSSKQKSSFNNT